MERKEYMNNLGFFKCVSILCCLLAWFQPRICSGVDGGKSSQNVIAIAEYEPKDYSSLLGMPGFSDALLQMHFQLYRGYVKNSNLLINRLHELETQNLDSSYEYGALKRRFGWEFDGMRLHELYFENMGSKVALQKSSALYKQILKDFGSYESWKKSFISTGMIRGIGWVILYRDPKTGRLFNTWINEHDVGHLAGGTPLLVMDVFEHAYITEYGLDRNKYILAFFENILWENVEMRFNNSENKTLAK